NSLSLSLQAKLLKAIESKSFRHLGGHDEIRVDTRIIAAINEEPFETMTKGRLRSDLFYRLNVITFQLPDLKDRQGDVEYLTRYYMDYFNEKLDMNIQGLSPEATALFAGHSWPGNVRELRNMLEAFERDLLRRTLASCRTKTEAAEKLGMTRQALNYRLTALQLK
ncbi:MAG: sigma 54-interacting transcriptional regulator, partial [Anaerovoracaceae bacterium]